MIINHDYKFVFVQIPHTGSTIIGDALVEKLGSKKILTKHSYLHELAITNPHVYRKYYIIGAVRNPLDERVSIFHKYKTNHLGLYTKQNSNLTPGNYFVRRIAKKIIEGDYSFQDYVLKLLNRQYMSPIHLHFDRYDNVMRFESLQQDLDNVLDDIGVDRLVLSKGNKTGDRQKDFSLYYQDPDVILKAMTIFGAEMNFLGYDFPDWFNEQEALKFSLTSKFTRYVQWYAASVYKWSKK